MCCLSQMVHLRSLMWLSIPRAMSVLILLPLLLAHRHPAPARPRASILRRMPMFYGKRDPSLASYSSPSTYLPLLPSSSRLRHLAAFQAAFGDFLDGPGHRRSPARAGLEGRGRGGKKTNPRLIGEGRSSDQVGRRPPWTLSSGLFSRLHKHTPTAVDDEESADIVGDGASPEFLHSEAWRAFRPAAADGSYREAARPGIPSATREERLRNGMRILGSLLSNADDDQDEVLKPPEEFASELTPLEVSSALGNDGNVEDPSYDDLLSSIVSADADDYNNDDHDDRDSSDEY